MVKPGYIGFLNELWSRLAEIPLPPLAKGVAASAAGDFASFHNSNRMIIPIFGRFSFSIIPAKAGIQRPAGAGMTSTEHNPNLSCDYLREIAFTARRP